MSRQFARTQLAKLREMADETVYTEAEDRIFKAAIAALRPESRQILVMRARDELSYTDISKRLGLSRKAVKQRIRDALVEAATIHAALVQAAGRH